MNRFLLARTSIPGTWVVWDERGGTLKGVPKVQIFHGNLEDSKAVAAAKNRQAKEQANG